MHQNKDTLGSFNEFVIQLGYSSTSPLDALRSSEKFSKELESTQAVTELLAVKLTPALKDLAAPTFSQTATSWRQHVKEERSFLSALRRISKVNEHLRKNLSEHLEEEVRGLIKSLVVSESESKFKTSALLLTRIGRILNDSNRLTTIAQQECESFLSSVTRDPSWLQNIAKIINIAKKFDNHWSDDPDNSKLSVRIALLAARKGVAYDNLVEFLDQVGVDKSTLLEGIRDLMGNSDLKNAMTAEEKKQLGIIAQRLRVALNVSTPA
jgi:hypothetical protein